MGGDWNLRDWYKENRTVGQDPKPSGDRRDCGPGCALRSPWPSSSGEFERSTYPLGAREKTCEVGGRDYWLKNAEVRDGDEVICLMEVTALHRNARRPLGLSAVADDRLAVGTPTPAEGCCDGNADGTVLLPRQKFPSEDEFLSTR